MLKLNITIFILCCIISVSVTQILQTGQCDHNVPLVENFDVNSFSGTWHQIFSYPTESSTGTCVKFEFSIGDGVINVRNTEVVNKALSTTSGTAAINYNDDSGKLTVVLDTAPNVQRVQDLWILATDYTNYAVTYSCINISGNEKRIYSSILSRTRQLSPPSQVEVNRVIESIAELNYQYYLETNQSTDGCLYSAERTKNFPVQFRGQCDNSIPVMMNFAPEMFMGLWHTIEMYPTSFQSGNCSNSLYLIQDGIIEVLNTEVVHQSLATTKGTATMASTDGSAKLALTLPIAGTNATETTEYWILATDYMSYALVYSCLNINAEIMQVNSWKLSRTNELTMYANWAIDQVITYINVLDQRYFQVVDQSVAACFYYPVPQPGTPVVFPGQCDDTIRLQNLDFERFRGTWYEILSYPRGKQFGQCISHSFTAESNTQMNLASSSVQNETLFTSNAIISTGSNGILIMTITDSGQSISLPLTIIDTDYSSYALVYSCVNNQSGYIATRTVWSWQLSRWRGLSAQANAAINNAISTIDVLDQRYYELVDQSDQACFVLPDVQPSEPVIFPGQCDVTIRPMVYLDIDRLLGSWTLIASYDAYKGTCNELTFSVASDGSLEVTVTQVVNQQLETIAGSAVFYSSGILSVEFPTSTKLYYILDTDYESYALVYNCENISSNQRRVSSWKMSRSKYLSSAANAAMDRVINSTNVLDNRYYMYKDHSDDGCFFYPEPDFDAPVVFRGQCDPSVSAFPNFDLASYMGLWYTIESYPAPFQNGQCNKAEYLPTNNGSVVIKKSQVVDQRLETLIGSAVVTSYDGTAKLNVTFNINNVNVTANYWVLATDYTNYALVYSCQNLDAETKAVYSWKLSRTKTLIAEANPVIDAVINSVQDLHQQYYIKMSHTEEECHYDDNSGDDDGVLLPGQCLNDSLVTAVHYFNPTLFAGTWYEVARYPSGIQKGECDASDFILSGSSEFTITHTTFDNATQQSTVTQATAPNGGTGIISASIGGVPFNKIFILATDYREYALAYACRNVNRQTKQVYSWKLSRTRSGLSEFANSVIDHVVNNDMDLYEAYYQTTRQDDDTCPHYTLDDDDGDYDEDDDDQVPPSIEFPGPCREIRGVPNFNAMTYLGQWYEMARYPTPFQVGQCSRVEYALSQQLVVSKTEVVRQTLRTQTGVVGISNDGSGFMNLIFKVNGEIRTAQQYILATDYNSYSLVYSCTNLDNGNSRVSSWKLSRTPTLSAEAAAAISRVIAETWALSEFYYQPTGQSDEDCFYVSS